MKISSKKAGCLAVLCLILASSPAGFTASDVYFFVPDFKSATYDLKRPVPADALHFAGYDDAPYSDFLYYQIENDAGQDLFLHLFYMDVGMGVKSYGMDYKLRLNDGRTVYFGRKYDTDQGAMASNRFDWRIGPNSIQGNFSTQQVHLADGPLRADLTFKTEVPFYQVGDQGKIYLDIGKKQWGRFTYFPLFSVTGTLEVEGTRIPIKGWGYGNRVVQHYDPSGFAELHTALRWQQDGLGFDVHDYQTTPELGGQWLPILMVYHKGRLVHVAQDYEKEVLSYVEDARSGKRIPADYRIRSQKGDSTVTIEFSGVKITDYNDPMLSLNTMEKVLVKLISPPPIDIRLDGQVKITLTTPQGTLTRQGAGHGLTLVSP
jgi:hypothetical protein